MDDDQSGNECPHISPLSEEGLNRDENQPESTSNDDAKWRLLMEQQNRNFMALIEAMKMLSVNKDVQLPEFNPEKDNAGARAWVTTADMCITDPELQGAPLMMTLSRAFKGQASAWLSQVAFHGMTWTNFKDLFTARYECSETSAAFLINLHNGRPKDNECLASYAATLLSSIMSKWKNLSIEQIAVSTVLAHISQFEHRVQKLSFTQDITTRNRLQQELSAISFMKRKASNPSDHNHDAKRPRLITEASTTCYNCGMPGHKAIFCRTRKGPTYQNSRPKTPISDVTLRKTSALPVTCFNCGAAGHFAKNCPRRSSQESSTSSMAGPSQEKQVNVCVINTPAGTLRHAGGVWSLRNLSISVPRAVLSGEGQSALLKCTYDLEGAALYSIRWYRAQTEFYRYVPREMPPTMVFPLPGASVDLAASDHQQVRVVNLNRRLSGEYQCEVTADAPLFHTDIRVAPLTVVDPPFRAPRLSVSQRSYSRGDMLRANCSVDEAYPAPNITWILDDHKIAEAVSWWTFEMDFKERGSFSHLELTILESEHYKVGLTYTSSSLSRAYQDHYIYNRDMETEEQDVVRYTMVSPQSGQFSLGCVATIYDIYARKSEPIYIREDAPHPASVTGEDSSGATAVFDLLLTIVCASASLLLSTL